MYQAHKIMHPFPLAKTWRNLIHCNNIRRSSLRILTYNGGSLSERLRRTFLPLTFPFPKAISRLNGNYDITQQRSPKSWKENIGLIASTILSSGLLYHFLWYGFDSTAYVVNAISRTWALSFSGVLVNPIVQKEYLVSGSVESFPLILKKKSLPSLRIIVAFVTSRGERDQLGKGMPIKGY